MANIHYAAEKKIIKAMFMPLSDAGQAAMGEGMTIGFNGMKRATIIGTPMAGRYFQFPTEY